MKYNKLNIIGNINGIQTLASILLPLVLAVLGYSFVQLDNFVKSGEEIQMEVEEYKFRYFMFRLEADRMKIIEQVIDRIGNRRDNIENINAGLNKNLKLSKSDITELELQIVGNLFESVEDYGKLQQFDSENYLILSKAAKLFSEVLTNEKKVWLSLGRLLKVQTNANVPITTQEEAKKEFSESLTEYGISIKILKSQITGLEDEIEILYHRDSIVFDQLTTKINSLRRTAYQYALIGFGSLIIAGMLALVITGIQFMKKD